MIFIIYLIKMIVISGFLYGYYCMFLRNQPFHFFNRFYLIGMVFISAILPLVHFSLPGINGMDPRIKLLSAMKIWDWEEAITITPRGNILFNLLSWQAMAWLLYIMIALVPLGRFLSALNYIRRIIRENAYEKIGEVKIYKTAEPGTPFSFFKRIFWNLELDISNGKGQQILRHEMYHVREKHSVDILLMELATILFWFNPFFYLAKKESKTTHEFLADQYAISGNDKFEYAELLVWQSAVIKQAYIHNYFFHNQIKRRIIMLTQFKNARFPFLRKLLISPLLITLFCTCTRDQKNTLADPQYEKTFTKVEIEAEFPGSQKGWSTYLNNNLKYPQKAIDNEIQGDVLIKFLIDKEGSISEVEAMSGPSELKDEAIRAIQKSGKWIPAVQNGHIVRSYKIQPIKFRLERQ
jgi:TonB family protein